MKWNYQRRLNLYSKFSIVLFMVFIFACTALFAKDEPKKEEPVIKSELLSGLKFRNIGPAFTSGRIADFAVNPGNPFEYYVAVASGHIWKTTNNGITFEPIFDDYGTYSIGCLAMDSNNPNIVWAGTGENNHQRALGYGNGVYKTVDGGKSWKNMGLKESRQIGMIAIDPRNSDVVYVAAEGSAWGTGGERGLYKTTDGGNTWTKVLNISENTGINNIVFDPRNPDILYATSEQRRRHVHTKIGGGPESAIHKSTDAGKTWRKLESGLPKEDMGGIGIAVSPVNPDIVYAIIEAANSAGGFFRSTDRGESWQKMSDYSSSGQYYNEIYCDPVNVDKVFSVETVSRVTLDAGKTWQSLGLDKRHVDDHALWINPSNTNNFMIGGDGGIYITYDNGKNYMHVQNLPVTQFYRVALDNETPFYNVFGGTQDNNSFGGPSRNFSSDGVTKGEWIVTIGGDGFWTRIDPLDPNIVYSEYQYGNVYRFDKKSHETVYIKPTPEKGELTYKWNWNTPFIISPHKNTRLYMAANVVFKSDDRGNTWQKISDDLTANIDRNTWPVMGKFWSIDAVAKDVSTSLYGIIISLDESPAKEGLIYAGTDDGVISVTEDGGKNWRKISSFPGIPANTYVSDIYASRFDENVVYASFDNILRDDFKPYILKSSDKGKTWISITKGLPENGTVHTLEQDFIDKDLLFAGTEFGAYYSYNGGNNWVQLKNGLPANAVKDMTIQQRETDLVIATFGRGFYILDDYSPLREINPSLNEKEASIFPIKDALMYIQKSNKYGQGATEYLGENPPYGATFTYYLKDVPKTQKEVRQEKEKELFKEGKPIPQPTWKELEDEAKEIAPYLIFTITDEQGNVIRKLTKSASKGVNRITWDLQYSNTFTLQLNDKKFNPIKEDRGFWMVMPGKYNVSLGMYSKGEFKELVPAKEFEAKSINNTSLPAPDRKEMVEFQRKVAETTRVMAGTIDFNKELIEKMAYLKQAIVNTPEAGNDLMSEAVKIEKELNNILFNFEGLSAKASDEEIPPQQVPLSQRLYYIIEAQINTTSAITNTSKKAYEIINEELPSLVKQLEKIALVDIKNLETKLEQAKAPYTPGRLPVLN
ncbi:MAG: glycosyl hydrolase [Bacteroidetes bacterium GWC2_33_15]|nr:MAG: glycosyl hydrolase [Bacteroidetes bacterium GWA2_33_15]OFX50351.1 MAG: glycosyl hydrolase [Bacteroidetes bacterium GWC2_33_15]OFX66732.1 MAG: glycosyl hydrolase [Bacteroidetes bacterium GWB2_32_14]OFX69350.1 MAG: glycosyl hydrolase [Bacteroidetes bacterium GWD2_33_33]HAN18670.1 glycosyl hydrolase [Bacteroidales bacterium]